MVVLATSLAELSIKRQTYMQRYKTRCRRVLKTQERQVPTSPLGDSMANDIYFTPGGSHQGQAVTWLTEVIDWLLPSAAAYVSVMLKRHPVWSTGAKNGQIEGGGGGASATSPVANVMPLNVTTRISKFLLDCVIRG